MGLLSLEVCDQRPSVPIDSAYVSTACFFDELCLNYLAWVTLHRDQSYLQSRVQGEALLVLTSGNIQILLLPYYEILGIPMKFLLHIFDRTLNSKATEIESWRQFQPFFT